MSSLTTRNTSTWTETCSAWLRTQRPLWIDYVIILVVFTITYLAVLNTRFQFVPDSQYYLGMAYWFSGMSQQDAHAAVTQLALSHGYLHGPSQEMMFGYGLVQPRVVLPVLATPLVALLGADGLKITTGLLAFIAFIVFYWVLAPRFGRLPAVATLVLALSSVYVMWFSTAMLTEALSALWGALLLVAAYRFQRTRSATWIVVMIAVTTLSAFTRQATFVVAGAFILAWVAGLFLKTERRKWGIPALAVAGTAVILQVLQSVIFPSFSQADQFMQQTGTSSVGAAVLAAPRLAAHLLVQELTDFAHSDLALLVMLGLSMLSLIIFWKRTESHLLLGAILGVALYNITNGTPTSFRYAIPGLVFYLSSIALLMTQIGHRFAASNSLDRGIPNSASRGS